MRCELDKHADHLGRHTKVQVPLLTTTTKLLKSGVLSGRGSHASSTTVGSVLVANTGKVPFTGSGNVSKYVMGSCVTPCTVAFWRGMTVLSRDATEIASIPVPGLDVKNPPSAPSLPNPLIRAACRRWRRYLPAAIVTILPVAAMRLETTALELSVHPSAPPSDIVRTSTPSLTP